jgi:hypothetical protein
MLQNDCTLSQHELQEVLLKGHSQLAACSSA